jgi:RHS repeat-associated protein
VNRKRNAAELGLSGKHTRGRHVRQIVSAAACATLLLLLFVFGLGTASGDDPGEEVAAAPAPEVVSEIAEKRTATSRTFELSDGQSETRLYGTAVNFKNSEGDWKPIDEELDPAQGGGLTNGANSFDLQLPEQIGDGAVRISTGEGWVSYRYLGQASQEAEVDGAQASYEAPDGGTAFVLDSLSNGLKETIVLADSSQPATYSFSLEASAGLTPALAEDGGVDLSDPQGHVIARMPAPTLTDADGAGGPVHYSLEDLGQGQWKLSVEADRSWLDAPERAWPVAIDPSTILSPTLDCDIWTENEATSDRGYCASEGFQELWARSSPKPSGADYKSRPLLRFNVSALPKAASVTSAKLKLYSRYAAASTTGVEVRRLTRSWTSAATWKRAEKTFNGKNETWTTPGGDFAALEEPGQQILTSSRGSQAGWWEFDIPGLVNRWLGGSQPNNGVIAKLIDDANRECGATSCTDRYVEFDSSAAVAEHRPVLTVTYMLPATTDKQVTSPTDGTKTAKRFLLASAWEQSGVEGITFQYKGQSGWINIPEGKVLDSKTDQTVKWPIGVEKLDRQSGPLYWDASDLTGTTSTAKVQIRAVFKDLGGESTYTKPVTAEVDRNAGGPKDAASGIGPGSVDLLTGNFTISQTDVSISGIGSALEFSRSFSSREAGIDATGVLGPGWKPSFPVEEAGGAAWTKVKIEELTEEFEGESETFKWAAVSHAEGGQIQFEEASNLFVTPAELSGYVLARLSSTEIALSDPAGNRTIFSNEGSGSEYLPKTVSQTGGSTNRTKFTWEFVNGKRRLKRLIAPSHKDRSCNDPAWIVEGCRVLEFSYQSATTWGAPAGAGDRLAKITYNSAAFQTAQDVAKFEYDSSGRLKAAWDPRVSPALKKTYAYNADGQISTLTPPGQEPWTMQYGQIGGETSKGRLTSVKRATLVESKPTAQTTIAYGVPLSKEAGGPYDMGVAAVGLWDQTDVPTDATAIFPPDEVPSSPPSSWTRASVYYMDAEGQLSNVATPSGAGTSAPSITTTETDQFGNVIRELGAQNRLRALAQESEAAKKARSRELDSQFRYSPDGSELQEEEGPMHQVRLESGSVVQARSYRAIEYDANFVYLNGTTTPSPGETKPHLPTSETSGAIPKNQQSVTDKRTTKYIYDWKLRKPKEVISNPETTDESKSVTLYDPDSGLPTQIRQPKEAEKGTGAGTTKLVYYRPSGGSLPDIPACESTAYAGLPCKVEPAAQPGISGQPNLPVRQIPKYNPLGEPEKIVETSGGSTRETLLAYDAAGRQLTKQIVGGGQAIPTVQYLYNQTLGLPWGQYFVCPASEPECDHQTVLTEYDALGRPTTYKDADGNEAITTYDYLGRPATVNDGKGTQTYGYDPVTGLLVELKDSAAGTFTASYDADGQLVKRVLPNGLTAETTFDEAGAPVGLSYTKASNCGTSCNWLNFAVERSIGGQIVLESGSLGKDEYAYDKLGRLITARETPSGGNCTTRSYKYDKDSNREEKTTTVGIGGVCSNSGGTTQKYSYDSADRLLGEGLTYDNFGRITNLPAVFAGGKALTTTYFSTNMVASQSQNGVSNTFQLDATLRQRQRLQAGGLEGVEVFHYAGPRDSPAWTQRGSVWTRSIAGIGGELAAIQESGKEVELQLTNLHGDVSASAALSPTATELKATFKFDEFGNPTGGSAGRFGWLGGKQRRTELPSGVIQMGARSYVPSLGRFLTPDPILGGSANPYDYANQDPINNFDLNGEECESPDSDWVKRCRRINRKIDRKINKVHRRTVHLKKEFAKLKARMENQRGGAPNFGAFEDAINSVLNKERDIVSGAMNMNCEKAAVGAGSGAYFLKRLGLGMSAEYPEFGAIVIGIGDAAKGLAATLGAGATANLC